MLLALGLGMSAAAMAEPQAADGPARTEPDASRELEEVQITGSRVKRSGFDAPNPLTVVSAEQIEQLGQVSVAETLNTLPQNTAFQSDTNIGIVGTANVGSTFANLRGLNPFYGTRTLTLVDSRRFVPTSDGGAVDLNMIPSMLVGRIETVTGGASAAYGSDAVAGVVNVILDKSLEGIKTQIDYGQTFFGDGQSKHASIAGGFKFAGERAHMLLGAEYHDSGGVGDCARTRTWCAEGWDIYTNSGFTTQNAQGQRVPSGYNVRVLPNGTATTNPSLGVPSPTYGQPNFIIGPGSKQSFNVSQGVFRDLNPTPAALRFKRFNDAGTALIDMDPGLYNSTIAIGPRQGGDGDSTYEDSALRAPIERYSLFSHLSYTFSDSLQGSLETSFGARDVSVAQQIAGPRSTFFIRPDNPYLSPAVAALFPANGQASLGKDIDSQDFRSVNSAKAETFRVVAGLEGSVFSDWEWDAYYQYGRNTRDQTVSNTRVNTFFQYALDAVRAPNGQIVCRATLQGNPDASSARATSRLKLLRMRIARRRRTSSTTRTS
jgi:iron complex outermembrane recepter protein